MNKQTIAGAASAICLATALALGVRSGVSAQGTFPDPNANCPVAECGQLSSLIPMQSTEAVHMGLVWKKNSDQPKILFHARFSQYSGTDVADPDVVDAAIDAGALTNGANAPDFNSALRDVLHPAFRNGTNPTADAFQRLTYGGYLLRQGLSQSVPTRILSVRNMERQLVFDINHPDAFKTSGKLHTSLIDEADFRMNRAAFTETGYSRGMFYNTYCNARTTLADGRVYVFGGHDMQSDNGLYKVNIFDPDSESWVRRLEPCDRASWAKDPFGLELFARDPKAQFFENCDPRDQQSTQPSEPSDQKYARWYPAAAPLPNGMVLVIGGFDQDNTVPPDPDRVAKARQTPPQQQRDDLFTASRVNQVVPEVYDPKTDRNIALENARMAFPLYPQLEVVETGPGRDDWKVCTMNGEENFGPEAVPGGAKFFSGFKGKTWCLDVPAALKDPKREMPAQNHWTLLDTASEVRPYCCPTASTIEIDRNGRTVSHKWFMISGLTPTGAATATIEAIDFADPMPKWRPAGQLAYPLTTRKAVVLPDGKVLLGQGLNRGLAAVAPANPVLDFERREGLRFHMYDPATGAVTPLARTTVSRGLHGTATLLPNGTVFFAGENREALVRTNDPSFPLMTSYARPRLLPTGDPDQGVPVGQIFSPPYLFSANGARAMRPVIDKAPDKVGYGGHFDVTIAGDANRIVSVALLRSDHNTHSFTGGDRYVKLAFEQKDGDLKQGSPDKRKLRVRAPELPAQAVPGIYMLFVVDRDGVPSMGHKVVLRPENRGE